MHMCRCVVVATILLLCQPAVAAEPMATQQAAKPTAAQKDEAKKQYEVGSAALEAKEFEVAARAFEKAYKLDPNPILLWNMARAQHWAGHLVAAKKNFIEFLKLERIPPEKRAQAAEHMAKIEVALKSKEDEAALEKERLARLERERQLERQLELAKTREQGGDADDAAPIAVTIAGAVLLLGAIPFHVWSLSAVEDMDKYDAPVADLTDERRLELYEDAKDTKQSTEAAAGVLYGVGGAALITGIVLFFVLDTDDEDNSGMDPVAATPWVAPGASGLSLSGRF